MRTNSFICLIEIQAKNVFFRVLASAIGEILVFSDDFKTAFLQHSYGKQRQEGVAACLGRGGTRNRKTTGGLPAWLKKKCRKRWPERVAKNPQLMRRRKALIEHCFGTIKRSFGYDNFLCRGKEKVTTEINLTVLAYNLKTDLQPPQSTKPGRGPQLRCRAGLLLTLRQIVSSPKSSLSGRPRLSFNLF